MLKRIVAITFAVLLPLAFAGKSIAETTVHTHPGTNQQDKGQDPAAQRFQQIMQQVTQGRSAPKPDAGPKGAGTTSRGAAGRK